MPLLLVGMTLGVAFWTTIVFILCASTSLSQRVAEVCCWVVVGASGVLWIGTTLRDLRIRVMSLSIAKTPNVTDVLLAAAIVIMGCVLFLVTLRPAIACDADVYHLTIPKLYLANGGFRKIALNVFSNWPLNIELLFALAMSVQDYILAKLVHYMFGVLCVIGICWVGFKHRDGYTGLLGGALFLMNGVVLFECHEAYVDLAMAFFLFMGWACINGDICTDRRWKPQLLLAGICCGIMTGAKLTGITAAFCLGVFHLVVGSRHGSLRSRLRDVLMYLGIPTLAMGLPWVVKAWEYTGNPFYPFSHDALGGPDWSRELSARFWAWQREIGMGRSIQDYVLVPVRCILYSDMGYDRFDGRLNRLWIVCLPLALVAARNRSHIRNPLALALLYFLFWAVSSQQMRLLMPIIPLLSIACAYSLADLRDRIGHPRWRRIVSAGIAVVVVGMLGGGGLWHNGRVHSSDSLLPEDRRADDGLRSITCVSVCQSHAADPFQDSVPEHKPWVLL